MTDINTREVVLDMLLKTFDEKKFSHLVLNGTLKKYRHLDRQERAFISRIYIGTIKRCITLDYIIDQFASLKSSKMKPLILNLLRLSTYQIMFMDGTPDAAVCNEAVKVAKKRGFIRLSGFVNGVLRNIARNKQSIKYPNKDKDILQYFMITYSIPEWLVTQLMEQYEYDTVEKILISSMKEKETTIRCNLKKITPDKLIDILISEGVTVKESDFFNYAFSISNYDNLEKLDSFRRGYFSIQDISSMIVIHAAGIIKDDYVIDVCAAPGGKALHASEKAGEVLARDISDYKISIIRENISRLSTTNVKTMIWDATKLDQTSINKADVVIADVPCSGIGMISKKPDIKYKLTQNQQKELVELQRSILRIVKDYVKPGGILMYSTCTINRHENLDNINWFLDNYDFKSESMDEYLPVALRSDTTKAGYLQLIQGVHSMDGFFIAKMRRNK